MFAWGLSTHGQVCQVCIVLAECIIWVSERNIYNECDVYKTAVISDGYISSFPVLTVGGGILIIVISIVLITTESLISFRLVQDKQTPSTPLRNVFWLKMTRNHFLFLWAVASSIQVL